MSEEVLRFFNCDSSHCKVSVNSTEISADNGLGYPRLRGHA